MVISLMSSVKSILALIFLLFLMLMVFALLGMQLFGGQSNFPDGIPNQNYDRFFPAFLTVFQVLTGEDWVSIMHTTINGMGGVDGGGFIYSVYYVIVTLIGNFVLLNVFLAIAVDNLANAAELSEDEEEVEEARKSNINRELDPIIGEDDSDGEEAQAKLPPLIDDSSLFIFEKTNPIRVACTTVNSSPLFINFILVIIGLSSLALAADDPIATNPDLVTVLYYADLIFTCVFIFETIVKIIALGFILHPGSFMRSIWNVLDIIVVVGAILGLVLVGEPPGRDCDDELTLFLEPNCKNEEQEKVEDGSDLGFIKTLRVFRVLRPLKSVQRLPKLQAVFNGFITSIVNVAPILSIYGLFMLIFSVVGMELFGGKFFFCTDQTKMTEAECTGHSIDEVDSLGHPISFSENEWLQHDFHFDDFPNAFLSLYVFSTGASWPDGLWNSIETTKVDRGPVKYSRMDYAIFYVVFIIVFPFFFVNVFIAFVILTFQSEGDDQLAEQDRGAIVDRIYFLAKKLLDKCSLEKTVIQCIDYAINAKPISKYMPKNKKSYQFIIWKIVTNQYFDNFILLLIILNTVTLMIKHYSMSIEFEFMLSVTNVCFTTLFSIECTMKIFGFGPLNYFSDAWNLFDFVTVVGSLLDTSLVFLLPEDSNVNLAILRLFRAARLLKLLRQSENIRILLWTFMQSLKSLPYVCLLIFLLFFIYSIVGIQMFGNIKLDEESDINYRNNFQNFGMAMLLLFRVSTGDGWQGIMLSCIDAECDPATLKAGSTKRCGSKVAIPFFTTFIFLGKFL